MWIIVLWILACKYDIIPRRSLVGEFSKQVFTKVRRYRLQSWHTSARKEKEWECEGGFKQVRECSGPLPPTTALSSVGIVLYFRHERYTHLVTPCTYISDLLPNANFIYTWKWPHIISFTPSFIFSNCWIWVTFDGHTLGINHGWDTNRLSSTQRV